jgi:hypothetical protein
MDAHRKAIIHGSGQSCWRTPPQMVEALAAVFPFQLDLAATSESCIAPALHHLGPGGLVEDALAYPWVEVADKYSLHRWGFLNPPFSLSEIRERKQHGAVKADTDHLRIEKWAQKAYEESLQGFSTIGVFPYAPQSKWFRRYVMGHVPRYGAPGEGWSGHAALDYWRLPHRVSFLQPDGSKSNNAGVNTCIVHWGPNPGFVGPWVPSGRYWSYR